MGELCQQRASSPVTTRAHQGYSLITPVNVYGPYWPPLQSIRQLIRLMLLLITGFKGYYLFVQCIQVYFVHMNTFKISPFMILPVVWFWNSLSSSCLWSWFRGGVCALFLRVIKPIQNLEKLLFWGSHVTKLSATTYE